MGTDNTLVTLEDFFQYPFYILLDQQCKEDLMNQCLKQKKCLKDLAKKMKCNPATLTLFIKNKKRHLKAGFLKNLLDIIKIDSLNIRSKVYSIKRGCRNPPIKVKLPIKATPQLALLFAKTCGDGGISSDGRFHYSNTNFDLMKEVIESVQNVIGEKKIIPLKRRNRDTYETKFSSVTGYLLTLIGSPRGPKINQPFRIPLWITDGNKDVKKAFLKGIFDDESCVEYNKKRYCRRIIFAMGKNVLHKKSLMNFLDQIKCLLAEFNVETSKVRVQTNYKQKIMLRFTIYRKRNFENFQKFIGFTHKKKNNKLTIMIDSY